MESCIDPFLLLKVIHELSYRIGPSGSILGCKRLVSPITTVVMRINRQRPILMHRQVEAFDWDRTTGQVFEDFSGEEFPVSQIVISPVNISVIPNWTASSAHRSGLVIRNAVKNRSVSLGKPIIVHIVRWQAITIHLWQEAQSFWDDDVMNFDRYFQKLLDGTDSDSESRAIIPSRHFRRNVDFYKPAIGSFSVSCLSIVNCNHWHQWIRYLFGSLGHQSIPIVFHKPLFACGQRSIGVIPLHEELRRN